MTDPRWMQPAHGVWNRAIQGHLYEINYRPDCYIVWHYGKIVAYPASLTAAKRAALKHAKENGK